MERTHYNEVTGASEYKIKVEPSAYALVVLHVVLRALHPISSSDGGKVVRHCRVCAASVYTRFFKRSP